MRARIAVLAGDGIGPEVTAEGVRCLDAVAARFRHDFELHPLPFGGAAIDTEGDPLPPATLEGVREADAVLLGAIEKKHGLAGVMDVMGDPRGLLAKYNECATDSTVAFKFDASLAERVAHIGAPVAK